MSVNIIGFGRKLDELQRLSLDSGRLELRRELEALGTVTTIARDVSLTELILALQIAGYRLTVGLTPRDFHVERIPLRSSTECLPGDSAADQGLRGHRGEVLRQGAGPTGCHPAAARTAGDGA